MIIVVEGADGCGKSTRVKWLIEWLEGRGKNVITNHFPNLDAPLTGKMISDYMNGSGRGSRSMEAIMYTLNMKEYFDKPEVIEKLNDKNTILVLDRYITSTFVYNGGIQAMECPSAWADQRDFMRLLWDKLKIPMPDHVFVTIASPEFRKKAFQDRYGDDGPKDIYEKDSGFQEKVQQCFIELTMDTIGWARSPSMGIINSSKHEKSEPASIEDGKRMFIERLEEKILPLLK